MISKKQSLRQELVGMQKGFIHSLAKYAEGSKTVTEDNPFAAARHAGIKMSHEEVISSLALIMHDWKGKALREHAEELLQVLKKEVEQLAWVEIVPYYSNNISQDLTREKGESQMFFFREAVTDLQAILHPEQPEPHNPAGSEAQDALLEAMQQPDDDRTEEEQAELDADAQMLWEEGRQAEEEAEAVLKEESPWSIMSQVVLKQPEPDLSILEQAPDSSRARMTPKGNFCSFPGYRYAVYGYAESVPDLQFAYNSRKLATKAATLLRSLGYSPVCLYDQRQEEVKVTQWSEVGSGDITHYKKSAWSFPQTLTIHTCQTFDRVGRMLDEKHFEAVTSAECKRRSQAWAKEQVKEFADVKEYRIIGSDSFYIHKMLFHGRWQNWRSGYHAGY